MTCEFGAESVVWKPRHREDAIFPSPPLLTFVTALTLAKLNQSRKSKDVLGASSSAVPLFAFAALRNRAVTEELGHEERAHETESTGPRAAKAPARLLPQ